LEWQFLSVGAVDDDDAIDGQFPCWEAKGITTSLPALIVFVVIDSTSSPKVSANHNALHAWLQIPWTWIACSACGDQKLRLAYHSLPSPLDSLPAFPEPVELIYRLLEDCHFLLFWPHHLLNVHHLHLKWLHFTDEITTVLWLSCADGYCIMSSPDFVPVLPWSSRVPRLERTSTLSQVVLYPPATTPDLKSLLANALIQASGVWHSI